MKIEFLDLKKISDTEVADEIADYMEMSYNDRRSLRQKIRSMPIYIMTKKPKSKVGFWTRLTILPILFIILLMGLLMPFKWVFTGTSRYDPDGFFKPVLDQARKLDF